MQNKHAILYTRDMHLIFSINVIVTILLILSLACTHLHYYAIPILYKLVFVF